jgi:hypothetical protein
MYIPTRKEQKKSLLATMELAAETSDVTSTKSLFEAWEKHFGFKGKKYAKRLAEIRDFIDHGTKIWNGCFVGSGSPRCSIRN